MSNLSAVKKLEAKEQQSEVVAVTPDMALKWLETNTHNRNVSDGLVDAYADDMKAKAWRLTHQGIAFDVNGVLVDGQHRLWAIVRSKMTVRMMVTHGVDADSLGNIDGQRVRTVGDQLGLIHGIGNNRRVAAQCGVIRNIELGYEGMGRKATLDQTLKTYQRHKPGIDWALSAFGNGKLWGAAPLVGAMAYCYPRAPTKAHDFARQVVGGENITRKDPAYALRRFVTESHGAGKQSERRMLTTVAMRAFFAYCHEHELEVIKPAMLLPDSPVYQKTLAYFRRGHS